MEFTVEKMSNLERRIKVSIPAPEIDAKTIKKLEELSKKVKLHGFRPGKVPLSVVKQRYGEATRQEVIADAIQASYIEVLAQEKLRPAGQPHIEPEKSTFGEPLQYIATFEVYPEIELHDLTGAKIEKVIAKVEEKDVENMLQKLRKQKAEWQEVQRASKTGDQLIIDFEGKIKGESFSGSSGQEFKFELGAGSMLADFKKPLVGVKAEDKIKLKVKFPKDYSDSNVAGKKADFEVKVHRVLEPKLPELDAKFLEKMGVKEGGEAILRNNLRASMQQQLENALAKEFNNNIIMDKLLELNPIEVPKVLVDNEIERLQQQAKQQFMQYIQGSAKDLPDLPKKEFAQDAKRRVILGLLLAKMIERDNIKVDPAIVKAKLQNLAKGYKNPAEVVNWYYNNKEHLARIESMVLEEQVLAKLQAQVEIKEKTKSYEEVVNA